MKILMYNDGTEYSLDALSLVKMHAKAFNAHVDILSSMHKGEESDLPKIDERKGELEYLKEALEKENISCQSHLIIKGHAAGEDIVKFAIANRTDEIIIGTEKLSRVGKFLLGSTAQHVIIHAPCPVVIV